MKLLIVIPNITFDSGTKEILSYIDKVLLPYNDDTKCEPHTIKLKNEVMEEYEEYKEEYPDISEYCMKYYAGYLNENGDLVSTLNDNAFWDVYEICDSKCWYQESLEHPENLDEFKKTGDGIIDNCIPVSKLTYCKEMCIKSINMIFDEHRNIFNVKCCCDNQNICPNCNDIDTFFSRNKNEYVVYLECQ